MKKASLLYLILGTLTLLVWYYTYSKELLGNPEALVEGLFGLALVISGVALVIIGFTRNASGSTFAPWLALATALNVLFVYFYLSFPSFPYLDALIGVVLLSIPILSCLAVFEALSKINDFFYPTKRF